MASVNSTGTQFYYSLEKQRWILTAAIVFAGSGTPLLMRWVPSTGGSAGYYTAAATGATGYGAAPNGIKGIAGIVRNGVGDYTITLQAQFQRLLAFRAMYQDTAAIAAANVALFGTPEVALKLVNDGTNPYAAGGGTVEFKGWAPSVGLNASPTASVHGTWAAASGATPGTYTQTSGGIAAAAGALVGGTIFDTSGNGGIITGNTTCTASSGVISVGGPVGTPATANTLVITPPGTGALGTPYVATDPTTGNGTTTGLPCIISMEFDNSTVG